MSDNDSEYEKFKEAVDNLTPGQMLTGIVSLQEEVEGLFQIEGCPPMDQDDLTAAVYVLTKTVRYLMEDKGVVAEETEEPSPPAGE